MRCIDADALLTWFDDHYDHEFVTVGFVTGLIKDEPTIEPERKKGKWIRTDMTDIVDGERINWMKWNCSECGVEKKIGWAKGVKFCPNCGADMREE